MMDFDCPLAFRHKNRGVHMLRPLFALVFVFKGRVFLLVGACGVVQIVSRCFTLYFTFLALATFVLPCWDIHVRGAISFMCFLFQTAY